MDPSSRTLACIKGVSTQRNTRNVRSGCKTRTYATKGAYAKAET